MKISKFSSGIVKTYSVAAGCEFLNEAQVTVGVAPVAISSIGLGPHTIVCINRSAAGQIIRVGQAPAFGPPVFGLSLLVNDVIIFEDVLFIISAVASAAGALLDIFETVVNVS